MFSITRFLRQTRIQYHDFRFWLVYSFFKMFPLKRNKIVFSNFDGRGFGDSGKYIILHMLREKVDADMVWLVGKHVEKSNFPKEIRVIRRSTLLSLYELATAKVWVDNVRKSYRMSKRQEQYYIQTWHGGIGPKRVEKDVEDKLSKSYIKSAKQDSQMADLFLSNSGFTSKLFRNSFWYHGEILECGLPRNDILFDHSHAIKERVLQYFNFEKDVKILLYAPTFRKDHNMKVYDLDYERCIKELGRKTKHEWKVLVKLHPGISHYDGMISFDQSIVNATRYDDMQELMVASDLLVTDYSSVMFEFAFTKKPVFLFVRDISDYMKDRNFYFDIRTTPFPLSVTNDEMVEMIKRYDDKRYIEELDRFLQMFDIHEKGNASERVTERILKVMQDEQK